MKPEDIRIDAAFRERLPPLTVDEYATLKANILRDGGLNDAVKLWEEKDVCIDGNNRLEIFLALKEEGYADLRFPDPVYIMLANRDEAERWIDDNARGQRNLLEAYQKILRGRQYNAEKKADGVRGPGKKPGKAYQAFSDDLTSETIAKQHGKSEKTIRNEGKRATVYDAVIGEFGRDSKEARAAMTASQPIIDAVAKADTIEPAKVVATIEREKKKAKKANQKKADSNGKSNKDFSLYDDCDTPFQQMLNRVKPLGRVPRDEFYSAIGEVTSQKKFSAIVNELHYMHIQEDDDGTCELFIDETERELCTAIHAQLERMRTRFGKGSKFKFNLTACRKVTNDLYELVRKASTHK